MEIFEQTKGNVVIVNLRGRLDAITSPSTFDRLESIAIENSNLLIDGTDLHYISSAGIRVILQTHALIKEHGGKFAIYSLTAEVRKVLNMVNLASIISLYSSQEDAIKEFASGKSEI